MMQSQSQPAPPACLTKPMGRIGRFNLEFLLSALVSLRSVVSLLFATGLFALFFSGVSHAQYLTTPPADEEEVFLLNEDELEEGYADLDAEEKAMMAPEPQNFGAVHLQGLDKVTARRRDIEATMGAVTRFGNLEVIPRACWKAPAGERPETAALLEIWYWKPGEQPSKLFYGWMFASSPALSSLEHPIYDVTVLECLEKSAEETGEAEEEQGVAESAPQVEEVSQEGAVE